MSSTFEKKFVNQVREMDGFSVSTRRKDLYKIKVSTKVKAWKTISWWKLLRHSEGRSIVSTINDPNSNIFLFLTNILSSAHNTSNDFVTSKPYSRELWCNLPLD